MNRPPLNSVERAILSISEAYSNQRLVLGAVLTCLFAWMTSSVAFANPTGAVISIKGSKEVSPELEAALTKAQRSVYQSKLTLLGATETESAVKGAGCSGASCSSSLTQLFQRVNTRFVVITSVNNEFDMYTIKVAVADSDYPERALVEVSTKCEFCDEASLIDKLKELSFDGKLEEAFKRAEKPKGPTEFVLSVVTSPAGAEVFLDGKSRGLSPVSIPSLKAQAYTIEVKLNGYIDQKKTLTPPNPLPADPLSESFTLKPKAPEKFPIVVQTIPPGASVTLDGVKIKVKSPFKAKVKPGSHTIVFSLEGYEDQSYTFKTPAQAETIPVDVTLKKVAPVTPPDQAKADTPKETPPVAPKVVPPPSVPPATLVSSVPVERPSLLSTSLSGALLGVGAVVTGIGGWLLSIHGEVACNDGRDRKTCPEIYDSKYPAGILIGLGTASLGAGLISMIINGQWPDSPTTSSSVETSPKTTTMVPAIVPLRDGAAASFSVSF